MKNSRLSGMLKILTVFIFLMSIFVSRPASGPRGYMPVRNFPREVYSGGNQNWGAVQDSLGRMYFANSEGLLAFDGARWRRYSLSNSTAIRSLYFDSSSGRIYAGATTEFGYFAPDSLTGGLHYTSLLSTLPEEDRNFSEIWNIFSLGGKIWFQGDFALFRYDGKSTIAFPVEERIAKSAVVNSGIIIGFQNGNLMRFRSNRMQALPGTELLKGKKIAAILPFGDREGMLIATAHDGLYVHDGSALRAYPTEIDRQLKESQIFCAAYSGQVYVFGTVNDGAFLLNAATGRYRPVNRHNGMQNNTVLSIYFDKTKNLWLMLDNGIDYAIYNSPVTSLLSKKEEIGAGYASIIYGDVMYLGTNQGLYSRAGTDYPDHQGLKREISGQIWSLDTIGQTLFAVGDAGVFYRDGLSFRRVGNLEGGYKIRPFIGNPQRAVVSTYSGFHVLENKGDAWTDAGPIKGYDDIGGNFIQAPDGAIWFAHWMKGVYRLTLTKSGRAFSKIELFDSHSGLPTDKNNSVILINGDVHISSEDGIFRYDRVSRRLVKVPKFSRAFSRGHSGHLYLLPGERLLKVNPREFSVASHDASGEWMCDSTTYRSLSDELIPGFEHIGFLRPDELIVSCQNGFKCVDLNPDHSLQTQTPAFVSAVYSGDSLLYMPPTCHIPGDALQIPFGLNNLRIEFASPEYLSDKGVEFSTKLDAYDKEWSAFSFQNSREYTRLHEGRYRFRVRARHLASGEITESEFEFRILPPWYRTFWAYMTYLILIITSVILLVRQIRRWKRNAEEEARLRKENEMAELLQKREREALKKDHEIAVLKSQQLEHDVMHKSSELGNITMNLMRKNQILAEIAGKISRLQEDGGLKRNNPLLDKALADICRSINENISQDEDWKRFTENFDIVYRDFTRTLREMHPDLTEADIRICCYIRMGLSSKEIAQLVNISFRSVEMTRYRLRKKINLAREDSLSDYLRKINS